MSMPKFNVGDRVKRKGTTDVVTVHKVHEGLPGQFWLDAHNLDINYTSVPEDWMIPADQEEIKMPFLLNLVCAVAVFFGFIGTVYIGGAAAFWDANPANWDETRRVVLALLAFSMGGYFAVATFNRWNR